MRYPFETLPTGWYAVGLSADVVPGAVRSLRYFGRDLVLFRTASGVAHLVDAYCPHLGAHLGDGDVRGERLRCPFHRFEFDGGGRCVKTGYGTRPPAAARIGTWVLREQNGLLLAWYDVLGRPPAWEVPALPEDGWTPFRMARLDVASHPQETSENSVDLGHFTAVHAFRRAWATRELAVDGPVLRTGYGIERPVALGPWSFGVEARFEVAVHGLGVSIVEGEVPAARTRMRILVLSTPVDEGAIHLRIGVAVERARSRFATALVRRAIFRGLRAEVAADAPIWSRKRYVERPLLAAGDGPIAAYRRWCRQFYPTVGVRRAAAS
jgi:nitrite reductase/ring-hydroxylating ferredoxin subunit